MIKDEFVKLPLGLALGAIWDALNGDQKLATAPTPRIQPPPKYDTAIYRREGVQWASECSVDELRFWHGKKMTSSNPEYAEKDQKIAKQLDFWIAYRIADPNSPWTGERNRQTVTARAPSGRPTVYPRDERGPSRAAPKQKSSFDDDFPSSYGGSGPTGGGDDSDIPFHRIGDVG